MHICLATEKDADALSALAIRTFRETFHHYEPAPLDAFFAAYYTPQVFRQDLANPGQRIWLAKEADNTLTGYAKYRAYRLPVAPPCRPAGELHRLYVRAACKGQGIGNQLMRHVLLHAKEKADAALYLSVWDGNDAAQAFYDRHGFGKIGEYIYDPPVGSVIDTEWVMMKLL